ARIAPALLPGAWRRPAGTTLAATGKGLGGRRHSAGKAAAGREFGCRSAVVGRAVSAFRRMWRGLAVGPGRRPGTGATRPAAPATGGGCRQRTLFPVPARPCRRQSFAGTTAAE